MRKVFALGLLALSSGFLANTAFAGNVEDCEVLKDGYTKALYGLCIAWHNAGNDNARERILENYEKKAGPNDPPMPGTEDEVPCPCWDETHLAVASENGTPIACSVSDEGSGVEFAVYDAPPAFYQFFVEDEGCFRTAPDGSGAIEPIETTEQSDACRAGIQALVDMDFGGSCL